MCEHLQSVEKWVSLPSVRAFCGYFDLCTRRSACCDRLPPAQKCPPAPVRMIALVSGSADAAANALPRSSEAAPSSALRRVGRFMVITRMRPSGHRSGQFSTRASLS